MPFSTRSSGSDDRNRDQVSHRGCEFTIIACLCAVAVHACEKYLTCSKTICLVYPLYGIKSGINSSAVLVDVPASFRPSLSVYSQNDTLAAEHSSRFMYEFRPFYGCRVNRYFISAFS